MPSYEYRCSNCGDEFEEMQPYHSKPLVKCRVCRKHALERLLSCSLGAVKQDPKTIGHLAERNTSKMSTWELESKIQEDADMRIPNMPGHKGTKGKRGRKMTENEKKLANANEAQVHEYITKGKLPE